jgi:hypothetical protein
MTPLMAAVKLYGFLHASISCMLKAECDHPRHG